MGLSTCMSCQGAFEKGMTNPELSKKYALAFCFTCGPTFWREKNYIEVDCSQIARSKHPKVACIGCEQEVYKVWINGALRNSLALAFCKACLSRLIQPHRWVEFIRQGREEDLGGYAPAKLDMSTGFEAKEVTGVKR